MILQKSKKRPLTRSVSLATRIARRSTPIQRTVIK